MSRPPKKDTLAAMLAMQETLLSLRAAQEIKIAALREEAQEEAQEEELTGKPTESREHPL